MASKKLAFFPGCSLDGTGSEYGHSTLAVLEAVGKPAEILEDWNCCGATAARGIDLGLSVRLAGRNLALGAKQGCDVLVACAACYNNMAFTQDHLTKHPEDFSEPGFEQIRPESVDVYHLLSVLSSDEMLETISSRISNPLDEMVLACYYGCLLVRPGSYTDVDDRENPQLMDKMMTLCGAKTVDWSYKTDCCGGSASLTRKKSAMKLMARIFEDAIGRGANAIVTACPLCHMNLDAFQRDVGAELGKEFSMPVFYFTELLALAMGLEGTAKWFKGHLTSPAPVVRNCR